MRLAYGVPEPVVGGRAAIELYSGGLWPPTPLVELLTTDASRLRLELMEMGFPPDGRSSSDAPNRLHPIVVGIENLIADQISKWLQKEGRRTEVATLV